MRYVVTKGEPDPERSKEVVGRAFDLVAGCLADDHSAAVDELRRIFSTDSAFGLEVAYALASIVSGYIKSEAINGERDPVDVLNDLQADIVDAFDNPKTDSRAQERLRQPVATAARPGLAATARAHPRARGSRGGCSAATTNF